MASTSTAEKDRWLILNAVEIKEFSLRKDKITERKLKGSSFRKISVTGFNKDEYRIKATKVLNWFGAIRMQIQREIIKLEESSKALTK